MMLLAICLCNCTILTLRNVKCLRCFPYRHTTLHLTDGCLHAQWVPLPPNPGSHNFRHFYCGTGWGSLEAPLTYTEKCYRVCSSISSAPTSTQLNVSGAVPGCTKLHPGTAPEQACIRLRSISRLVSTWSSGHVPACRMSRLVPTWSPGHVPACRMSRLISTWSLGHVPACKMSRLVSTWSSGHVPACRMSRLVSTWSSGHVPACRMSRLVSTWSSGHVRTSL